MTMSLPRTLSFWAAAAAIAAFASGAACDRGPRCDDVAAHMVELANAEIEGDEVTDPEARDRLSSACASAPWPEEIRRCLLAAADQEAATACMRDLADEP